MLPTSVRIFLCAAPQDMRRSFDGLAAAARQLIGEDLREAGAMFVFVNKRKNRAKVLWWEKNGYCLLYKRLHQALFALPDGGDASSIRIDARALAALLQGATRESETHTRAA